jgi:hypothetical protein
MARRFVVKRAYRRSMYTFAAERKGCIGGGISACPRGQHGLSAHQPRDECGALGAAFGLATGLAPELNLVAVANPYAQQFHETEWPTDCY